nr:hypothetical protein [Tanacetum cinerariifolium]
MNQNYFEPNSSIFDQFQPPQYPVVHQPPQETSTEILQARENLMEAIQVFLKKYDQIPSEEKCIALLRVEEKFFKFKQALEEEKNQPKIIQELLLQLIYNFQLLNEIQPKQAEEKRMNKQEEKNIEELLAEEQESIISTNTNIFETPSSDAITTSLPVLPIEDPEDSFIIGNEELNTIPEKESDEFIKSSGEDLVPILKAITFSNPFFNSNDDFISSDNESLSDEDVLKDNVNIYSNPLFKFDDEYISSDINPLFNEVLEDIECKDSYDPNLGELTFLVIPISNYNEDEYFTPGDDVGLLLHHDPFIHALSVASILEVFTDEPPLEENEELFDLEPKNDD